MEDVEIRIEGTERLLKALVASIHAAEPSITDALGRRLQFATRGRADIWAKTLFDEATGPGDKS